MRLSPLDVQHMEFDRSVSGYKRTQVRAFLERVASEREELLKENQALRDEIAKRDERIEELKAAEADLKRTVVAAERVGNQIKENARREADLIVREADTERRDARAELRRLQDLESSFREQFRGMLHAFEEVLDRRAPAIGSDDLADAEAPAAPVEASRNGGGSAAEEERPTPEPGGQAADAERRG